MKQTITIQYREGPQDLPVIVRGSLALHRRRCDWPQNAWTIIHVPTGRMVLEVQGCRRARMAFRALIAMDGWDRMDRRLIRAVWALRGLLRETAR